MTPTPAPTPEPPARRHDSEHDPTLVHLWISHHDEMRWVTLVAVTGTLAAITLAVIGGLRLDTMKITHHLGWVLPTCGLTRGSTAIARGDLALAWNYNPASFLVMAFAVGGAVRALTGAVSGRWLNIRIRPTRGTWIGVAIAFVVLWGYQMTNADFIINSTT